MNNEKLSERPLGRHAVIIGGSIAGMSAACAVAQYFEHVTIVERDELSSNIEKRKGVPQGKHTHVLLAGGLQAITSLAPNFEEILNDFGAVRMVVGRDIRTEKPGYDPFPIRDLEFHVYSASYPLFEYALRSAAKTVSDFNFITGVTVKSITGNSQQATGIAYKAGDSALQTIDADLVIDASGRGELTRSFLNQCGLTVPEASSVNVGVGYSTVELELAARENEEPLCFFTLPDRPKCSRNAALIPIEGGRYMLTISGYADDQPPGDIEGFYAFVNSLRTSTIAKTIENARQISDISRFRFVDSYHGRYERMETFPGGLLPIGRALCRINPIYGQGMSLAALEAVALEKLLNDRASLSDNSLEGISSSFFREAAEIIKTPWEMASICDMEYPSSLGVRSPDSSRVLTALSAIDTLASEDFDTHKLQSEVAHLLRKSEDFYQGPIGERIGAYMSKAAVKDVNHNHEV